jgi:osmoprotectant transport system ATP-binding protein
MAWAGPTFQLTGAAKIYGGVAVLGPIDLTIERGTTTVLLGTSGSGKSTLLRLLNGLLRPDAGQVLFRGEPPRRELRLQMGYVIQGGGLFPHLSAADNVALLARWLGWDAERIARRISELAELVRLPAAALERFLQQLSGGQAQRVGLMRALMLDPEVLLLDEPLGALDPITRFELQQDLRDVFARLRKTVVLVTHDLAEAEFFGGTAILLRGGKIVQRGSIPDMVRAPADAFVARFVEAQRPRIEAT